MSNLGDLAEAAFRPTSAPGAPRPVTGQPREVAAAADAIAAAERAVAAAVASGADRDTLGDLYDAARKPVTHLHRELKARE